MIFIDYPIWGVDNYVYVYAYVADDYVADDYMEEEYMEEEYMEEHITTKRFK